METLYVGTNKDGTSIMYDKSIERFPAEGVWGTMYAFKNQLEIPAWMAAHANGEKEHTWHNEPIEIFEDMSKCGDMVHLKRDSSGQIIKNKENEKV